MRDGFRTYHSLHLVLLLGASRTSASLGRLQPRLPSSLSPHTTSVRRSSRSQLGAQLLVPILRAVVTLGVSHQGGREGGGRGLWTVLECESGPRLGLEQIWRGYGPLTQAPLSATHRPLTQPSSFRLHCRFNPPPSGYPMWWPPPPVPPPRSLSPRPPPSSTPWLGVRSSWR